MHVLLKYPEAVSPLYSPSSVAGVFVQGPGRHLLPLLQRHHLPCSCRATYLWGIPVIHSVDVHLSILPSPVASLYGTTAHLWLPLAACSCTDSNNRMSRQTRTRHIHQQLLPPLMRPPLTLHLLRPTRMPLVQDLKSPLVSIGRPGCSILRRVKQSATTPLC